MLITTLENTIREANKAYRFGDPMNISDMSEDVQNILGKTSGTLTDKEYDLLLDKLEDLHPESDIFESGVIEDASEIGGERMQKLDHPMYSLNKETSIDDLAKWKKKANIEPTTLIVATPKLDGVSILRNESTTKSQSRGDGVEGQDITEHYKSLNPVSQRLNKLKKIENKNQQGLNFYTIGELIIPIQTFEDNKHLLIRDNGELYKNPRNTVAGLVNSDKVSPYWKYVDHIRYGIADDECKYDKLEQLQIIQDETGYLTPHEVFEFSELTEELLDELYYKWGKKYEIDGLVLDINDKNIRKNLGRETNNNPAYARAYKANWATPISTPYNGIEWNVSKEGLIKPVVLVQPFGIEGVTVSRATGYNARFILENNIGEGSIVDIIRSGSVIPKIVNVSKETKAELPTNCPCCNTELVWTINDKGDEVDLKCENPKCETKNIKRVAFFFSSLDVSDFGESIVSKFYKNGYNTVRSILDMTVSDISIMDGMGISSANKIINQFDKVRNATFEKLGHASGCFENLGSRKLKMVVDGLGGMEEVEKAKNEYYNSIDTRKVLDRLNSIHGVSDKTSRSFLIGLGEFDNFIEELGIEIKQPVVVERSETVSFDGRIFVFSGVRNAEIKEFIINNGGDVKNSVSGKTTDLIVKDVNSTTSKVNKARDMGINLIQIDKISVGMEF